jgi:hypothetical protein
MIAAVIGAVAGALIGRAAGRAYGQRVADRLAWQIAQQLAAPQPAHVEQQPVAAQRWHGFVGHPDGMVEEVTR